MVGRMSLRYPMTMSRPHYLDALVRVGGLPMLAQFAPRVAGTPPLALDRADSDIDVLCHAPDPVQFVLAIWTAFSQYPDFRVWQWASGVRPVIAEFSAESWTFEVFGSPQPVQNQMGWRHLRGEQRLLSIGGTRLRAPVMDQRRRGRKTEPAFAAVLSLSGDPYRALLDLETWSDDALACLMAEVS
jgi:Domain of unknown function (DUF4269)